MSSNNLMNECVETDKKRKREGENSEIMEHFSHELCDDELYIDIGCDIEDDNQFLFTVSSGNLIYEFIGETAITDFMEVYFKDSVKESKITNIKFSQSGSVHEQYKKDILLFFSKLTTKKEVVFEPSVFQYVSDIRAEWLRQ